MEPRGGRKPEAQLLRPHMPELDALRGLAVLMVILFHGLAPPVKVQLSRSGDLLLAVSQYASAGVNLFFVLSGFLITGILLRTRSDANYYRPFYVRRARRILPALVAILLALLMTRLIDWKFFILGSLFMANSVQLFGVALEYGPLWSLAVEEHFYLAWPALVRNLSLTSLALLLSGIVVLSPVLRASNSSAGQSPSNLSQFYTWLNLDGLAMGALLAMWLRRPSFSRQQLTYAASVVVGLGAALMAVAIQNGGAKISLVPTACNLIAVGLLSCSLLLATSGWAFLVDLPVLRFLGFISYGLYLCHVISFFAIDVLFARFLSTIIGSVGAAAAMLLRLLLGSSLAIALAYLSRKSLEEAFLSKRPAFSGRDRAVKMSASGDLAN